MENNPDKEALKNYAAGTYTRTDYRQVNHWFSREEDADLKDALESHWNKLPPDLPLNERMTRLLGSLKAKILFLQPEKKEWSLFRFYQKAAAVLFIPLILGFGYWLLRPAPEQATAMATIHSPEGARTEFTLPDGTSGWLNCGSELTYPVAFSNHREVKLTGEAYFDVVHRNGEKFRVKTTDLTVQVMGTSFNVAAYEEDSRIQVVLKEGRVQILGSGDQVSYVMKPDEKFSYDKDKKAANICQVNAAEQTAWTKGLLQFRGEPLSEVLKKLGRWYNVDFEIHDRQLQNYSFKATFKDEQLEEILRMIAITTPMKYQIEERKTNDNGIYMKKKIIIERK